MKTIKYQDFECVELSNGKLSLVVTRSVGPRVLALQVDGEENIFAELPDITIDLPGQLPFHFYGGHRLWQAPEEPAITYLPDDIPVEITPIENGCQVVQPVNEQTGLQKAFDIELDPHEARVEIRHTFTNQGAQPITCSLWAITQLKLGGNALIPLNTGLTEGNPTLPNRSLILWPYTDINSPNIRWENEAVTIHAQTDVPVKIGIPNHRGWLAYWRKKTLFVKRAAFEPSATYSGFGSSSECYCNHQFIELETIAPLKTLRPGESAHHTEIWEVYPNFDWNEDLKSTMEFIEKQTKTQL